MLARALFICTWAFSMRICEFTHTGKKDPGHNIRAKAIRTSNVGLSVAFHSDKTSRFARAIKHRTVRWGRLPHDSRKIVEQYIKHRPDGNHFFCKNDGRQLTRTDFLNLLDVSLIGSGWVNLKIGPHSFRQGRVSQESLEGVDMATIRHTGRWSERSAAFEAYARSDFAALTPAQILESFPQMKRTWTKAKVSFLALNVVQTKGAAKRHPFAIRISKHIPDITRSLRDELPLRYPHIRSVARTTSEAADRESKIYPNAMVKERIKKEMERLTRVRISRAVRTSSRILRHRRGYLGNVKSRVKSRNAAKSEEAEFVDTEIQTNFGYVQSNPTIWYKGEQVPIHQQALDLIPTENAWDLHMTASGAISVRRNCDKKNRGAVANANKLVKLNILSRISPSIRKRKRDLDRKNKTRPGVATERAITRSHKRLAMYFIREYMVKGEQGLPPHSETMDPMEMDEEFESRIYKEYEQKAPDYEEQFSKGRRMTVNHRVARRRVAKRVKASNDD